MSPDTFWVCVVVGIVLLAQSVLFQACNAPRWLVVLWRVFAGIYLVPAALYALFLAVSP